ncbi:DNA-directed RNA polymerase, mitochondrial [Agrilus planipennis]|uniref:DNA-directed RNA polymerase n=1 Tax=Agrilus planipennis TaxID=224129 RepID=A0A1W4WJ77_AGRPL|nr:DNA-directed RNA polymerase, mitochondrial [Agrilus planipennis]
MQRLLNIQNTQLKSFRKLTPCGSASVSRANSTINLNFTAKACLSTCPNPNVLQKKKKFRRKSDKKFMELLVVTDNSTKEEKAPVRRLGPKQLKALVESDFNLSVLFKLNPLRHIEEHTYNNLNIIDSIPETQKNDLLNHENSVPSEEENAVVQLVNEQVDNPLITSAEKILTADFPSNEFVDDLSGLNSFRSFGKFQPEVLEEEPLELDEVKETEQEKVPTPFKHKTISEEISSQILSAYVEICSNMKDPQRGLNALIFHRSQSQNNPNNFPPLRTASVYNALIKSFALKGSLKKIEEILKYAAEDGVNLNVQSFANIFDCLGRINIKGSYLKQIRIFVKEMKKSNITFNDIINTAIFTKEQKQHVLDVIQAYEQSYVPYYHKPRVTYVNHLVKNLNIAEEEMELHRKVVTQGKNKESFLSEEKMNKLIFEQLELEKIGYLEVRSIESKGPSGESVHQFRKVLKQHFKMWEESALDGFNRELAALTARRSVLNMEPYLRAIPTKEYIKIVLEEAKKLAQGSETYSPTVNQLYREMGNRVYSKYKVLSKEKAGVLDKVLNIHTEYCKQYVNEHQKLGSLPDHEKKINSRQRWQLIEYSLKSEGASSVVDHNEWVPTVLTFIGKFLYHIVMYDIKIDVNSMKNVKHKNLLPAFYTIFRNQGRIIKEEVKPHPILSRLYRASEAETLTFPASEVPMKCPPVPWISVKTGGYMIASCEMVRLPTQAVTQKQRLEETDPQNLYPVLDSLNQLAAVPWKVNERILDLILEVFNSGGSTKLDVPQPPTALTLTYNDSKDQKYQNLRQKLQFRRKQAEMYSLWCDCLYRLSLANHYRKDIFWLPHNMDFRGRVYPIPPHLNHLGSDLARSMLIFAEARPLGPHGLDWLKLHLVNLTGLKKKSCLEDRLIFANEMMDKILDSADKPLTGEMWWAESEEPWQTLACCMELAAAHRSPNPEEYLSHFPIHQDGSCNGLQHYAALGRDSAGAKSVNLTASDIPQDVYSAVVALVEEQRVKDVELGIPIAKVLEGFVHRKVIKQTVMTTVYGVTRFGARLQIARQLKDLEDFPKEHVWHASQYLTTRTFDSLRCMFTSTREIQDWFTECAKLIASVSGKNVEWITPLGLPVVQPYNKYRKLPAISSVYDNYHMDKYEKPNVMKQKNAFPPNFIHSLDSSHMMLTSLFCERAGITFVSVHDCYWTHPSTVSIMNKICREQFVALHSEPILENLSLFLFDKYSYTKIDEKDAGTALTRKKFNKVLRTLPKTSNFDIREVLNSVYFFS